MASAAPQAKIDVGRVLSRGFAALRANLLPFLAVSLLLAGSPAFLMQYWILTNLDLADPGLIVSATYWGWLGAGLLVSLLATTLLQGVLVRSTILQLSGRDPDLGASALLALRRLLPLIGLSVALALLIGFGLLMLLVPGVMIYCATIVSVPALIEERRGVFGSIARSRALTRGSRWHVFLLAVLFFVFSAIIQNIVGAVSGANAVNMMEPVAPPHPILAGVANTVSTSLSTMIVAIVLAALYVELREVKEGATTSDLADVFA